MDHLDDRPHPGRGPKPVPVGVHGDPSADLAAAELGGAGRAIVGVLAAVIADDLKLKDLRRRPILPTPDPAVFLFDQRLRVHLKPVAAVAAERSRAVHDSVEGARTDLQGRHGEHLRK